MSGWVPEFPELHQEGTTQLHNQEEVERAIAAGEVDFGLQVAVDGRVWVCVNGMAYIRFKPRRGTRE